MSVFITGASSGIGEACAQAFAKEGKDLILVARRAERLESLAKRLRSEHRVKVTYFPMDVQDRKAVEGVVAGLENVDVLINNAGLAKGRQPLQEGNPDDWDRMIDTNIKGLLYVTRALLPKMLKAQKGHVVNIGSVAGHWTYPDGNVYCATKHAVRALTESLRLDLHGKGIRVTEISPGMVETEFSQVRFEGDMKKAKAVYAGLTPLSAQDIAETVIWCVNRPQHVNIQEVVLFPTDQASVGWVHRK